MRGIFLEPFNASCPDPESQANSAFAHSSGGCGSPIVGTPFNLVCGQLANVLFCPCVVKIMVAQMVAPGLEICKDIWDITRKFGNSFAIQAEASLSVERGILRLEVARQLLLGGEFTRLLLNT